LPPHPKEPGRWWDYTVAAAIFVAFLVWMLGFHPFQRPIFRDSATWTYMSLEFAKGMVPHRDIFVHKTPGAAMLGAAGAWLAPRLGIAEPLAGVVAVWLLLGALGPALLYLICRPRMGLVAALAATAVMVSLDQWPVATFEAARPKVAMVTFGLAGLLAAERRRAMLSGLFVGASMLCWQPGLCFAGGAAWSLLTRPPTAEKREARKTSRLVGLARFVAGIAMPAVAFLCWLAFAGALGDFFAQTVGFNFEYVRLKAISPAATVGRLARILSWWDPFECVLALLALGGLKAIRDRLPRGLLVAGIVYAAMIFVSFQGWPDTLPLLPAAAAVIAAGFVGLGRRLGLARVVPALFLCTVAWTAARPANVRLHPLVSLHTQEQFYRQLAANVAPGKPVIAISIPEFLIHNHMRSAWKYPYMWNHVDRFAAAEYGGFDGMFRELERIDPVLIVLCRRWTGQGRQLFESWAARRYLRREYAFYPYAWPIVVFRKPSSDSERQELRNRLSEHASPRIPQRLRPSYPDASPAPNVSAQDSNS